MSFHETEGLATFPTRVQNLTWLYPKRARKFSFAPNLLHYQLFYLTSNPPTYRGHNVFSFAGHFLQTVLVPQHLSTKNIYTSDIGSYVRIDLFSTLHNNVNRWQPISAWPGLRSVIFLIPPLSSLPLPQWPGFNFVGFHHQLLLRSPPERACSRACPQFDGVASDHIRKREHSSVYT